MIEQAKALRTAAQLLIAEAERIEAQYGSRPSSGSGNIFGNAVGTFPGDPAYPGYQPGDGWQVSLRAFAARDGLADRNTYVRDRGLTPRWPDAKQDWEE